MKTPPGASDNCPFRGVSPGVEPGEEGTTIMAVNCSVPQGLSARNNPPTSRFASGAAGAELPPSRQRGVANALSGCTAGYARYSSLSTNSVSSTA